VDGTETGWGRPAEPAPRWRALLGRTRHGSQATDDPHDTEQEGADTPSPEPRSAPGVQPLPSRPVSPLDRRPLAPLEPPRTAADARPANPFDRRPVNPLDRRVGRGLEQRPEPRPEQSRPLERPVNPLDARRHSRLADGFQGRGEPEQPHSFFNPATRSVPAPPPITRVPPDNDYPPVRAAASVGSAPVLPPPTPISPTPISPTPIRATLAPAPAAPAPATGPASISPAPARIEWRQARPEQDLDRAVAVLRRKLGKPRVLAFANPKGGVHKTTATVLAAATIGSVRGRGVLAWDDNELRGTLGLRAGSARHARTIRHLVTDLLQIENMHGEELLGELDDYLRHASDGSYDVLAGEENPRFAQRLDQSTVHRVMELLRRTHDVICVDTGNNVESVNWQTVMKAADQLVITTVPREDAAFTADWMLDLLNDTGMEELVANAVTLISCPSEGKLPLLDDLIKHFATRTRGVAVVPYDPALEVGSSIEYAELQPETRAAWLRAAAVMIEPFTE
jgi:MinD-like ATPase involved in chromosome partitioning or flagellar assembly